MGKLMWVCNTILSLRVDFQAINVWVIELGMLAKHHPEVNSGVSFMKQIQGVMLGLRRE
jgi:hypothetical protein